MAKYFYPAMFHEDGNGGYWVDTPDLPGCFTEGDTLEQAIEKMKVTLSRYLDGIDEESYPPRTDPAELDPGHDAFIMLVGVEPELAREEVQPDTVSRTLAIPGWLNDLAEKEHINFSHILQDALKAKLKVADNLTD